MIKLKSLISEAGKIDRAYVKKEFDKFKRLPDPHDKEWRELVTSVIKHLGAKPTKNIIEDLEDHLLIIYVQDNKFPRNFPDATDFREMYEIIYR